MKRIFSYLFAIITLMGTTGVFTSCQEDAPAINYTINVTVNNDFTEVVNAINNGTMKQEAAIAALTAAINQMSGDQAAKLQALVEAINSLATTVDAKLAIIEAAMKAQTLALENKLALLEAAIKALPDYSDKLAAIETAIKNIPDYSEKMDAIIDVINNAKDYTDALNDIKDAIAASKESFATQLGLLITAIEELPNYGDQLTAIKDAIPTIPNYEDQFDALELALKAIAEKIEAQGGQYADELAALKTSIDAIKSEVAAGNKSQEDALAEIIALLESGALAGGGSGSGGEGEGGEDEDPYIAIVLNGECEELTVTYLIDQELPEVEGMTQKSVEKYDDVKNVTYKINSSDVRDLKLKGNITSITIHGIRIRSMDCTHMSCLEYFKMNGGLLTKLDVSKNKNLKEIDINGVGIDELELCKDVPGGYKKIKCGNSIFDEADLWTKFFNTLPEASESAPGELFIYNFEKPSKELDAIPPTDEQIKIAIDKNYKVYRDFNCSVLYPGESTYQSITVTTSKAIGETIVMTVQGELAASEVEGAVIKNSKTHSNGNTEYTLELKNQTVTIKQASIAYILFSFDQITSVDLNCSELSKLYCYMNAIKGENMTNLVKDLPDRTGKTAGKFMVYATGDAREENVITKADVAIAKAKNWIVIDWNNNEYEGI